MKANIAALLLGLGAAANAQIATDCPGNGVCYSLNIPQSTAADGTGDIFFQITAPSAFSWVAMGQGSGMTGSQIFVLYTDPTGNNVTLSPRLGEGHIEPQFNRDAQVTLLEGSGVSDGKMTANVRCSSCSKWPNGGSMDFSASSADFVFAVLVGDPLNGDESATIDQHSLQGDLNLNFAQAKGGSSVNPFADTPTAGSCVPRPQSGAGARAVPRPTGRPGSQSDADVVYCDDGLGAGAGGVDLLAQPSGFFADPDTYLKAHGILACLAVVVLWPLGAIAVRLLSFPGLVWLHAALQAFAYCVYIAAFGIGVYIANSLDNLDEYHPVIGILVLCLAFFQPFLGLAHHNQYQKLGRRTVWSHGHVWLGRIVITLGMINGGLGLMLADNSNGGKVAYGIVAGVIWLAYVASAVIGERRKATSTPAKATEAGSFKHHDEPPTFVR